MKKNEEIFYETDKCVNSLKTVIKTVSFLLCSLEILNCVYDEFLYSSSPLLKFNKCLEKNNNNLSIHPGRIFSFLHYVVYFSIKCV